MDAFCLFFRSVNKIPEPQGSRDGFDSSFCFYRTHLSFYNCSSRKWEGETYESPLHRPQEDTTTESRCTMNDLTFFLINPDDSVLLVIEIVLVIVDKLTRIQREIGLGWSFLRLDDTKSLKDISSCKKISLNKKETGEVYSGTPRALMVYGDLSKDAIFNTIKDASFSYTLCTARNLSKFSNILPGFTMFDNRNGSQTPPGLISPHVQFLLHHVFWRDLAYQHDIAEKACSAVTGETPGAGNKLSFGEETSYSRRRSQSPLPIRESPFRHRTLSPSRTGRKRSASAERSASVMSSGRNIDRDGATGRTNRSLSRSPSPNARRSFVEMMRFARKRKLPRELAEQMAFLKRVEKSDGMDYAYKQMRALRFSLLAGTKAWNAMKDKAQSRQKDGNIEGTDDEDADGTNSEEDGGDGQRLVEIRDDADDGEAGDQMQRRSKSQTPKRRSGEEGQSDEDEHSDDSDASSNELNDSNDDTVEFARDASDIPLVPVVGEENWVDDLIWDEEEDFGCSVARSGEGGSEDALSVTDAGIDRRGQHLALAHLEGKAKLCKGYAVTRGIARERPWLFGCSFLNPIRQETLTLKLNNFQLMIPMGYEEVLKNQLNCARLWEQDLDEDSRFVKVVKKKVMICQHNSMKVVGDILERELVQTGTAIQQRRATRTRAASSQKFQVMEPAKFEKPIVIPYVTPHPKTSIICVVGYDVEIPITTEIDADKQKQREKERGHKALSRIGIALPQGISRTIWLGWTEFKPFWFMYRSEPLSDDDAEEKVEEGEDKEDKDEERRIDEELDELNENEGNETMTGLNESTLDETMKGMMSDTLVEGTIRERTFMQSQILRQKSKRTEKDYLIEKLLHPMKKKMLISCPHLHIPPKIAQKLKVKSTLPDKPTKRYLRRSPTISCYFPGIYGWWIFDPTRGPLDGIIGSLPKTNKIQSQSAIVGGEHSSSSSSSSSYQTHAYSSSDLADALGMVHVPPLQTPAAIAERCSRIVPKGALPPPESEVTFPFETLHKSTLPFYDSGPHSVSTGLPITFEQPSIMFKLFLPDEAYQRLPVYVKPPWKFNRKEQVEIPEPVEPKPPVEAQPPPEIPPLPQHQAEIVVIPQASPSPVQIIPQLPQRRLVECQTDGMCSSFSFRFVSFVREGRMSPKQQQIAELQFPAKPVFSFRFFNLPRCWSEEGVIRSEIGSSDGYQGDAQSKKVYSLSSNTGGSLECSLSVDDNVLIHSPSISLPSAVATTSKSDDPSSISSTPLSSSLVLSTALPYRLTGDAASTSANTSLTLPEYLKDHSIQIEIFDATSCLPFAVGFLSLSSFSAAVQDGAPHFSMETIDLWEPIPSVDCDAFDAASADLQQLMFDQNAVQNATPSAFSGSTLMKSPSPQPFYAMGQTREPFMQSQSAMYMMRSSATGAGVGGGRGNVHPPILRWMGQIVVEVTHNRVRHSFSRGAFVQWLIEQKQNESNPAIASSNKSVAGTGRSTIQGAESFTSQWLTQGLVRSGKMVRFGDVWLGRIERPLKEQIEPASEYSEALMRRMCSSLEEVRAIREKNKQLKLQAMQMHNSSIMKVIYPSFAQPVYFEIPITNSQSTPVQIEVKMKKKPLKRIVKRILKNLGLKNSGSQFANEKTGIKEKSKIKSKGSSLSENIDMFDDDDDFEDEDELFVLTEEERLHYRAIWDPSNAFNVDNRQFMMNNFATQQKQAQLFDYVMGSLSTAALGKGKVTQQLPLSTGVGFDLVSKLSSTRSQKSKRKTLIELDGNEQRTIGFVFQSLKSGGNGISFFDERDGVIFKNEGNKASRASAEKEVSSILKEEEQFFAPLSNPKVCINSHLIQKSKRNESSASSSSSSSSSSTGISSLNSEFEASDSESDSSDSEEGSKGLLHSIVSQPTVTLGKLKDPFGDPINLSPAICPRIIGISFVEKKTLMPMLKSDVVVLPVGHHVDKTIRIHSKEGERVDLKLLLPQMLQTRDLIGGQPPFLKSIAERNEYSDDWANESNEKSKRMNRGGAQMIRDDERLCMTKKVIVSETTTFKGKRIEIEGFSDVKEEQLRETKSNLGPEGLLHEGERTLRQVVTLRCPSPANLPICCHESDTNIEMKQQRMQQYECEAFVDEFNKTTGDLGQTSKKLQRRADGVRPYSFEIALFNDPLCSWLYEIWEIVVYSHPAIHLEAELGAFSNITQKVSEVIVEREKRRDHRLSTALGQRDMDEQSIKEMMNDLLKRCDLKWYPGGEYDSAKVRTIEEVPQEIVQKSIVGNVDLAASEGSRLIMREEEISNLLFTTYIPGNKQILVNFVDQTQGKVEESLIIHCSTTINPQYVPMQYLRTEIPVMHRTWLSLPFSNGNDSISSATSFVVTTDRPDLFEISTKSFSLMPHGVMHIEVKVASRADEGSDVGFIYVPQFRSLEGGSVCGWRLRVIYTKMPSAAANQLLPDSEM